MHHRSQLHTEIFNDGTKDGDVLNSGCGADFVKVNLFIQTFLILKLINLIFCLDISSFGFFDLFNRYNKNAHAIWKTWKTELDVYP